MIRSRILALFLAFAVVTASCGGGDGPGAGEIGPDGGTVSSADGGLTLVVPAGALVEPVAIEITAVSDPPDVFAETPWALYRLEPDGLQFDAPVGFTLEVPFVAEADGSVAAPMVALLSGDLAEATLLGGSVDVDLERGVAVATGTLDHFSYLVGHSGKLIVKLEDVQPRRKNVGDVWEAETVVASGGAGGRFTVNVLNLQVKGISFTADAPVEVYGSDGHPGFVLEPESERTLDSPVPRWTCADDGDGSYGVDVTAELGGGVVSGMVWWAREITEGLPGVAANEWSVSVSVPMECVAAEPTTTTSSSTTTTVLETPGPGEITCGWVEAVDVPIDREAIALLVAGDIAALIEQYADLAASLGYTADGAGAPPPLQTFDPMLQEGPMDWSAWQRSFRHQHEQDMVGALEERVCNQSLHSDGQQSTTSQGATDIIGTASATGEAPPEGTVQAFGNTDYPCGAGERGTTVCGELPFPEGQVLVVAMALGGLVPAADPAAYFQYGFVFDTDGDPANDYQASAAFPNDTFDGTDLWYDVEYSPENGWMLGVIDPSAGFATVPSAARVVIVDYGMLLVVPVSEIGDPSVARYRVTAFRHLGDWGMSPPYAWNGDAVPPVGEPLLPIATG
ncbi:MAG: hypothetical protein KQH83_08305 [Actinobacteria bacterium]|nr:hypothetical protein [Actinomycetota bacterium]